MVQDYQAALERSMQELEDMLDVLKVRFDKNLYLMLDANGVYVAAPILITLVQGYTALLNSQTST